MANQNANDNDTNVINADNNGSNVNSNRNDDHDAYEKVCYVCRRPESKAGKMITISPVLLSVMIVCKKHLIRLTVVISRKCLESQRDFHLLVCQMI